MGAGRPEVGRKIIATITTIASLLSKGNQIPVLFESKIKIEFLKKPIIPAFWIINHLPTSIFPNPPKYLLNFSVPPSGFGEGLLLLAFPYYEYSRGRWEVGRKIIATITTITSLLSKDDQIPVLFESKIKIEFLKKPNIPAFWIINHLPTSIFPNPPKYLLHFYVPSSGFWEGLIF